MIKEISHPTEADIYVDSESLEVVINKFFLDEAGNAPLIPRSEFIKAINQMQLAVSHMLITLDQYAPEHFKETENRQPKVSETVWAQSTTGLPQSEVVHTVTT